MAYKFCPNCCSASYSQTEHKIWLCPVCGKDISFMPNTEEPPSREQALSWVSSHSDRRRA